VQRCATNRECIVLIGLWSRTRRVIACYCLIRLAVAPEFAPTTQRMGSGWAVDELWMGCGWALDRLWMGSGWAVDELWMAVDGLGMGSGWALEGLWMGSGWALGGLWMGSGWAVDGLPDGLWIGT
jgi:hypothetical protein